MQQGQEVVTAATLLPALPLQCHLNVKTHCRFELSFHPASDAGIFPTDILQARKEREAESLQVMWLPFLRQQVLMHEMVHSSAECQFDGASAAVAWHCLT